MPKKILITGGGGFIGFYLAKHLSLQEDYQIVIIDNFRRSQEDPEFKELLEKDNVSFVKGDITDPKVFEEVGEDFDYVYHMAMINGTPNFYSRPHEVLKVGIVGTLNVLDWFVKQPKGKLLFTSSSETYAGALKLMGDKFPIPTPEEVPLVVTDPKNVRWSYGGSKILSEVAVHSYAKVYGMEKFSIIRYHNIYGPRMGFDHVLPQFIERIVKKEFPFKIFGGQETRAFCYVQDGVKATQKIMETSETNGKTIHIGKDDEEITIINLAKKLFEVAGVNPEIDVQPAPEGCVMRRCPDITKLRSLGFNPEISLDEGLKKTYEWYKDKF